MPATARLNADLPMPAHPADLRSFLERLRQHTGMAGVALLGPEARWLEIAGGAPPTGISPGLLGPCGTITSGTDPAARFLITIPVPTIDPENRAGWCSGMLRCVPKPPPICFSPA